MAANVRKEEGKCPPLFHECRFCDLLIRRKVLIERVRRVVAD